MNKKNTFKPILKRLAMLCIISFLASSCASSVGVGGGGSDSFVSTTVENSSVSAVNAAVKSVFREEGFTLVGEAPSKLNFRKWGDRSTELIYGSWMTDGVAIEPEIIVIDRSGGKFSVYCDVYMREHRGNELIGSDWQVRRAGKSAYRGLMKKIKSRAENTQ